MEEKILRGVFDFFEEYDIIKLEGKYVEKFFNIATRKNIKLWNVRYIGKSVVLFNCYRKDYEKVSSISDKISAKLYIMDTKGVMHEVNKYKNRVSLYVGAVVMSGMIVLLSNTVCVIDIKGNERVEESLIVEQLKESGLSKGAFVPKIDTKNVQKKMIAKNSDLSWIGISINGARAEVEIVEKVPKPEIVDKNTPANIVALKDGIIESIVVKNGFPVAQKGDTVKKGQLIVSGINQSAQGDLMLIHSSAEVKLRTWNYLTRSCSVNVTERVPTGEIINKHYINFFGNTLNLFFGESPTNENYNISQTEKRLFNLPISLEKHECEKIRYVTKKYSPEEILEQNKKSMYDEIVGTLSDNHSVIDSEFSYTTDGENVIISLCITALEDGTVIQEAQF